jgi:hypothetical protein
MSDKKDTERVAQKLREQAVKYLEKEGQHADKNVYSLLAQRQSSSMSNVRDNTLQLLFKEKAELNKLPQTNSINKAVTATADITDLKQNILGQQTELRSKIEHPLPPQWKEIVDPESGNPYYWNTETQETSWTRPEYKAPEPPKPISNLPEGWIEKIHPATNQKYYFHPATGKSSSELPSVAPKTETMKSSSKPSSVPLIAANPIKNDFQNSKMKGKTINEHSDEAAGRKKRTFDLDMLDPSTAKVFFILLLFFLLSLFNFFFSFISIFFSQKVKSSNDERMADSTAGGSLWQQRPYPAPSSAVNRGSSSTASNIGPAMRR